MLLSIHRKDEVQGCIAPDQITKGRMLDLDLALPVQSLPGLLWLEGEVVGVKSWLHISGSSLKARATDIPVHLERRVQER